MKRRQIAGLTSQIWDIFVQDSSSTTGAGLGSLAYNTSGLTCKYKRTGDSSWTTVSLASATAGTFTSGGFAAAGSAPTGHYEFHPPNAALATGARAVVFSLYGAANMLPVNIEVELDATATDSSGNDLATSSQATAIKAKTDNLPSDPADASDIAASFASIAATLSTIAAYIDTEVAAIKAKTDNLPASPAAVGSAMTLADDAITAAKFDETTAFPVVSADSGSTRIARTGADSDTLETISDQIDGVSGGTGTGARSVTITVNDGTSPLETAKVRVTQGAETYLGTTNSSGVATFSLDDATWTVRVTKPGYTLSAQTLIVNGTETVTYSMTAVSVAAPSDPGLSRLVATCYGIDGQPEDGVKVHFQLTSGTGTAGIVHDSGVRTITSNADGELMVDGERPEFVIGATYRARRGNVGQWVEKTIPDADSFTWGEILGSP